MVKMTGYDGKNDRLRPDTLSKISTSSKNLRKYSNTRSLSFNCLIIRTESVVACPAPVKEEWGLKY